MSLEELDLLTANKYVTASPNDPQQQQRRSIVKTLGQNPLVRRWVAEQTINPDLRCTLPWHAKADQYMAAIIFACAVPGTNYGVSQYAPLAPLADRPEIFQAMTFNAVPSLVEAQTYLWLNAIADEVKHSPDLPPHIISPNLLPYPAMFFSFETYMQFADTDGTTRQSNWRFLKHTPTGVVLWQDIRIENNTRDVQLATMSIPYGKRWPDDVPLTIRPGVGLILKQLSFIASPYTESVSGRLERPQRRELQRLGYSKKESDPEIFTVILRHKAIKKTDGSQSASEVERQHHWWVAGHHRAQWYPSEQAHHVIWIAPYIKGDPSKPLLEKVYKIVR